MNFQMVKHAISILKTMVFTLAIVSVIGLDICRAQVRNEKVKWFDDQTLHLELNATKVPEHQSLINSIILTRELI